MENEEWQKCENKPRTRLKMGMRSGIKAKSWHQSTLYSSADHNPNLHCPMKHLAIIIIVHFCSPIQPSFLLLSVYCNWRKLGWKWGCTFWVNWLVHVHSVVCVCVCVCVCLCMRVCVSVSVHVCVVCVTNQHLNLVGYNNTFINGKCNRCWVLPSSSSCDCLDLEAKQMSDLNCDIDSMSDLWPHKQNTNTSHTSVQSTVLPIATKMWQWLTAR